MLLWSLGHCVWQIFLEQNHCCKCCLQAAGFLKLRLVIDLSCPAYMYYYNDIVHCGITYCWGTYRNLGTLDTSAYFLKIQQPEWVLLFIGLLINANVMGSIIVLSVIYFKPRVYLPLNFCLMLQILYNLRSIFNCKPSLIGVNCLEVTNSQEFFLLIQVLLRGLCFYHMSTSCLQLKIDSSKSQLYYVKNQNQQFTFYFCISTCKCDDVVTQIGAYIHGVFFQGRGCLLFPSLLLLLLPILN